MAETYQYLLGPHGVFEGTPEEVMARGYDPWQTQLFTEAQVPEQFGRTRFTWSGYGVPGGGEWAPGLTSYATGYLPTLLDLRQAVQTGQASEADRQRYAQMVQAAQAIPMRDIRTLEGTWGTTDAGDWGNKLWGGAPDLGAVMLTLADKLDAGTASAQERQLFTSVDRMMRDQDWRASTPQPSDAFNPLGDQFFQALNMLSLAAGGAGSFGAFGTAAGAGAAGAGAGASVLGIPASTLAQVGTLSGLGAMGTGMLGTALDQPWLQRIAGALGAVGGLAGGTASLANTLSGGISSLGEVGRLLSGASKLTGVGASLSGNQALRQASGLLKLTGGAGSAASGLFGGDNQVVPVAAADWTTQRGGPMEWDWSGDYGGWESTPDWTGYGGGDFPGDYGTGSTAWDTFTGWGDPYGPGSSGDPAFSGEDGGGWLGGLTSLLGSLGPVLGPAMQGLGSLVTGAQGASASRQAAGQQSDALNRALALQEAQWLQNQANQAPWLQAGRAALPMLQQLAGQGPAGFQGPAAVEGWRYAQTLPSEIPGWRPQTYAGYAPTETPSAAHYRWTPGQVPRAADYRYTPGAVPTLSGTALLANDPGVQFRLDEGRRALEASALARGTGLSGPALAALQRQGQDLSSQEYGQAWNRASQQAQLREQWNQVASQMGWSQAEAETRLREMLAQQSTAHNWGQALQEANARAQQQQFGWNAGFQAQQQGQREAQAYDTDLYNRQMAENQLWYGRDMAQNQQEYERALQAWNANRLTQGTAWDRWASLAGMGPVAAQQLGTQGLYNANQMGTLLGQLGSSQAMGTLGSTANLNQGIAGGINSLTSLLGRLNA